MVSAEKEPDRTPNQKRSRGASPNGHSDFSDDEREGGSGIKPIDLVFAVTQLGPCQKADVKNCFAILQAGAKACSSYRWRDACW